MKLPSIVKLAKYQRFNITPRHYDPIKEEIEQRTMAIKIQLQNEGVISEDGGSSGFSNRNQSTIRGSFRAKSKVKNTPFLERSGLLRILIFFVLLGSIGGYIYLGNEVLYYLLYAIIGVGIWVMLNRLKRKHKNE